MASIRLITSSRRCAVKSVFGLSDKFKNAVLKIDRASKHIEELNELIRKTPPFVYVLETDTQANKRSTYAKKNDAVADQCAIIAGDVLFNLRHALDYSYWQVVSRAATGPRQEGSIQFPFSETEARLEQAVKNRLAHQVSLQFFSFVMALKPYGESGGNDLLYLLHDREVLNKHRDLVPIGDYTHVTSKDIQRHVRDFPSGMVNCAFGQNFRDVGWNLLPSVKDSLGPSAILRSKFEEEINVPVSVVFKIGAGGLSRPLLLTLHQLASMTDSIVNEMRAFL